MKHADATHAQVRIGSPADNPAMLVLEVEDDGLGFDPATTAPGLGLISMGERAERLGGQLIIEGGHEGGTIVRLVVPGVLAGTG